MFMKPMLLGKKLEPFQSDSYLHEMKLDGHRLILSHIKGITRLYTRHQTECTAKYPEIVEAFQSNADMVLDGEAVCIPPGTDDFEFEAIMERFQLSSSTKISIAAKRQPVSAVFWDILYLNGEDLRKRPLMERKELLHEYLKDGPVISKMPFVEGDGQVLFDLIKQKGWEGVCAKPKNSRYIPGEAGRKHWFKIINYEYTHVCFSGYKKDSFGWQSIVPKSDGSYQPGGIVELAVTPKHRQEFTRRSRPLVIGENKQFIFLKPDLQGIVRHRGWTRRGLLRLPEFVQFC